MPGTIYDFVQFPRLAAAAPRLRAPCARALGAVPSVGVIYNRRSHRNLGADFECGMCPHVHIAEPTTRDQLPEALAAMAAHGIDLLVINGGDGTVRDVLTCGQAVFGCDWPALAVLPKGKTNALSCDLGLPDDWALHDAVEALDHGGRAWRRPLTVTVKSSARNSDTIARAMGFVLGAGAFTTATRAGQSAHRLGAFDGMVVALTGAWALLQSIFATRENPWRRGARMRIGLGMGDAPMAHSGSGDPAMRQVLFASTLERLPAGINPFGPLKGGLKLLAIDQISRRTTALIPLAMLGRLRGSLRERGIHQVGVSRFSLAIDDAIILDGEAFPPGEYLIEQGPELVFVTP